MFEVQLEHWKKTPLVTNTQPDWSRVGNSELVDRTIRSHNWLRTDTIFIENEQIEAISNRPPWVAAVLEVGMSDGSPESLAARRGRDLHRQRDRPRDGRRRELLVALELARGAGRERRSATTAQYPEMIDTIARRIGYRVRPSFVWRYEGAAKTAS